MQSSSYSNIIWDMITSLDELLHIAFYTYNVLLPRNCCIKFVFLFYLRTLFCHFSHRFTKKFSLYIFTIWKSIVYYRLCRDGIYFDKILVSEYKLFKRSNKANLLINMWRKSVFDIYFTEFHTALTTISPILFQYCYKYCSSDNRNLWAVMKAGGLTL
jgi:hypothetical protein